MMTSTPATANSTIASPDLGREVPTVRRRRPVPDFCDRFREAVLTNEDKGTFLCEMGRHVSAAVPSTWIVYLESASSNPYDGPPRPSKQEDSGEPAGSEAHRTAESQVSGNLKTRSERKAGNEALQHLHVLAGSDGTLPSQLRKTLVGCSQQALSKDTTQLQAVSTEPAWFVAAVPVAAPGAASVLLAVFDPRVNGKAITSILELAAVHVALWHTKRELADRDVETRSIATLAELTSRLASSGDLGLACYTLVDELQRFLECRQVVLGLSHNGKSCRAAAISGTNGIDRRSDRVCALEATLDESVVRGELTVWPPNDAGNRHAMMAHKKLAESVAAGSVVSSPIRDDRGELQGAWLFLGDESLSQNAETLRFILAAAPSFASSLSLLKRAERGVFGKWIHAVVKASRRRTGRAILASVLLLIGLMFLPLPYKVTCDCELQPFVRRYVAAPFDATLERSYVEPGDLVREDQTLAQIDGREIRWELAGLAADRNRAAKERDGHLATRDFGAAEVARHEVERLDIKAKLLEHRGDHLELRSPINGIVISGDLKKAEGVPLTVGQTLFEIAPLDSMVVEIAIPEEDVRHVCKQQSVEVVLDAFPGRRIKSTLARVHPRSEVRATDHVFIGEFDLDNPDELLRPGIQGTAKIVTSRHSLGWIVFHKPWEKMLYWMGW